MTQDNNKMTWKRWMVVISKGILNAIFSVSVLLLFVGFFLVYINSNIEYFQELPNLIKFGIPIGFMAILFKILSTDWEVI